MSKTSAKHRVVFRIDVDQQTAKRFLAMCEETGVSQIAITSRLVQWFCKQDEQIQARIMGVFGPDGKKEAARLFLERIAQDGDRSR